MRASSGFVKGGTIQTDRASLIVYGTTSCSDCQRVKRFLGAHRIQYTWVDMARVSVLDRSSGRVKQAASAAGEGATAAVVIREYLRGQ